MVSSEGKPEPCVLGKGSLSLKGQVQEGWSERVGSQARAPGG